MDLTNVDIEELVAYEGYEYRLSNGNRGLQLNLRTCPNCGNDSWKVYINADTGLGNCFVCNVGLNPFSFIMYAKGFENNKSQVFRYFEGQERRFAPKPNKPKVYVDPKLNADWKLPLNKTIELDEDVPQYLLDRGINAKIAKRFDLRVCDAGFYKYTANDGSTRIADFSNRIIIPIYDISGKPATFQGRDITGASPKKYLFPAMLPGTARYIYNAYRAKIQNARRVILNEGVFDVFATTRALESEVGYKDWIACGTFGKHFSVQTNVQEAEDQLADLHKLRLAGVEEFCIMWDGEPKARLAAVEAALKLRGYGFNVTVALGLPDGCDPAESTSQQVLDALDNRIVPTKLTLVRMRMKA